MESKRFCGVCGRHLTKTNIKGKCVECEDVVCKSCGTMKQGKVMCKDCIEDSKKKGWEKFLTGTKKGLKLRKNPIRF
ncbi:MAG: hypothetical protein ISS82_00565 [Nanoarchaeota archaeon]|nr:hypothetical protein [Nanoarchaeota archaeon]